ncbi:MAG: hypothetical protein AAGG08_09385, partial [Actinomycetota bacterium]
ASVAIVALAACGSDSDGGTSLSGADQELADAISAEIAAEEDGIGTVLDPDCLGTNTVAAIGGADGAAAYGLTVDTPDTEDVVLSAEDAEAVAAAYADCGDLKDAFVSGMTADDSMTAEQADCLFEDFGSDDIQAVFAESLQGVEDGPANDRLFEALFGRAEECGLG